MSPSTHASIFFLPPSPSDTNPPLGPAILARRADDYGLHIDVRDLNIEFINQFKGQAAREWYSSLGDHGKDRRLVRTAAAELFKQFEIDPRETAFCPDIGDPDPGMHYTFQGIHDAVERHVQYGSKLASWLDCVLDEIDDQGWPGIMGISIMGPSQVFCSLLLLALIKRRKHSTLTVIGGSHVTLLSDLMLKGSPYLKNVDIVLPGHSEDEFVDLLVENFAVEAPRSHKTWPSEHFSYLPLFSDEQLRLYAPEALTLPVQFTRGCSYARCTYCTYPVVEPVATKFYFEDAVAAIQVLKRRYGIDRFSLKDSLLTVPMLIGFAESLLDLGVSGIKWSGTTKIVKGLISRASMLAESGLATVELGVETIFRRQQALIDKKAPLGLIEDVIQAMGENGIVSVVNLMFGFPGETLDEAQAQLEWASALRARVGMESVDFSLNMLEVVRGTPMAKDSTYGVVGVAPWAYRYQWSAPRWRPQFVRELDALEERGDWVEGLPS